MRFYAGIDPGVNGGIAIVKETGDLESVYDMPVKFVKDKKHVNADDLYLILLQYKILRAYIEDVHATPQMGVTSSFNFGNSLGIVQGVLAASEIAQEMISPQRWKNHFSLLKKEKDYAREKVIQMFPGKEKFFKRKKDVDRAEACLIAMCGMGQI